jgi:MFS family permease
MSVLKDQFHRTYLITLIALGTLLGMGATDLILPAIPILPTELDGTASQAQWVLAAYVFGVGFGLILFGELGARFKIVTLLVITLAAFSVCSLIAAWASSLNQMSAIRFFQGLFSSATAVFAPVMIKSLFQGNQAVSIIGRISSIEAIAPAIAPIFGVMLLNAFGWRSSFYVVSISGFILSVIWIFQTKLKEHIGILPEANGSYFDLLCARDYMKYALSHAFTVGALLTIVFSAPKIITSSLGGSLSDFITMQILGIALFIVSANMTQIFNRWWGDEQSIRIGSTITAIGCLAMCVSVWYEKNSVVMLWIAFMFVNLGVGIRGPIGFYKALLASGNNDSRGSALLILLIMMFTALGTVIVAPFIDYGLVSVSVVATIMALLSVIILQALKPSHQ